MKRLLKTCIAIMVILYGITSLITEFFIYSLPYSLLYALVLCFIISILRIPPPQLHQAEIIVGEDLWLESESGGDDSAFYLKTVAHRGAGLDAPENSLPAFQLVNTIHFQKGCLVFICVLVCREKMSMYRI